MAGWFPIASFCLLSCSAVSFSDDPGLSTREACNAVLAKNMRADTVMEFVESGGSVQGECLPAVRVRNRQPQYFIDWLNGKAPGEPA